MALKAQQQQIQPTHGGTAQKLAVAFPTLKGNNPLLTCRLENLTIMFYICFHHPCLKTALLEHLQWSLKINMTYMWSQETRSCFIPWCPWWSVAPETHLWSYGSWAARAALANEATEQQQAALPDRSCSLAGFAASASVAVAGVLKQKCMISTAYPWEEKIIKIEMIEDTHF